jgi:hypothetical protein
VKLPLMLVRCARGASVSLIRVDFHHGAPGYLHGQKMSLLRSILVRLCLGGCSELSVVVLAHADRLSGGKTEAASAAAGAV